MPQGRDTGSTPPVHAGRAFSQKDRPQRGGCWGRPVLWGDIIPAGRGHPSGINDSILSNRFCSRAFALKAGEWRLFQPCLGRP